MNSRNRNIAIAGAAATMLTLAALAAFAVREPSPRGQQEGPMGRENQPTDASGLAAADLNGDGIVYRSVMHPWIVQDAPGQCPICGMDLVPVRIDQASDGAIRIDPAMTQNMGVRTAPVEVGPMQRTIRTTGRFEAAEPRVVVVSPKISGWIERLYVNYVGARVTKGQPLLEIYSPELVTTQEEYLLALRTLHRLEGTPAAEDAQRLVDAAGRRLAYWDITDEQIRELADTETPRKTLVLHAPASGTVVSTEAVEGQRAMAGETLMRLSDLSVLWLMVDVYEQDLPSVDVGAEAHIELPYQPGTRLTGRIEYIYDRLDPDTRSALARIPVANPGHRLKPGMYATVIVLGKAVEPTPTIPSEAVLRSGDRDIVILALGEGRFFPTEVITGIEADGRVQILRGLEGTETVVTSAQFLIDSEARLQSAVSSMLGDAGTNDPSSPSVPGPHAGH